MTRELFKWTTVLQCEDGNVINRAFRSFWSPDRDFVTSHSIANAAAASETRASGKKYLPISAQLVTE